MKHVWFISSMLCLISCQSASQDDSQTSGAEDQATVQAPTLDWLIGQWHRTNEQPDHETYELWTKANDSLYEGTAFTMMAQDTVWQERIDFALRSQGWCYEVWGQGDTIPVVFVMTEQADQQFACENPAHDFPKKITYILEGDRLDAEISGGGDPISFLYEKM